VITVCLARKTWQHAAFFGICHFSQRLREIGFRPFGVNLFIDDDDQWMAHLAEMPSVSAFGDSPEQAIQELETAWSAVKQSYLDHGEAVPAAPARRR